MLYFLPVIVPFLLSFVFSMIFIYTIVVLIPGGHKYGYIWFFGGF